MSRPFLSLSLSSLLILGCAVSLPAQQAADLSQLPSGGGSKTGSTGESCKFVFDQDCPTIACPDPASVKCGIGEYPNICRFSIVTGQAQLDGETIDVTAEVWFPKPPTPMNEMSVVGVHGGFCNGWFAKPGNEKWRYLANHLATNQWVMVLPHYRGDLDTGPATKCDPPDPGLCDFNCTELQDIRAAACFLKETFNTCPDLCPGGNCLDPDLVFGWGHSGGANRTVMTEVRYPGTFKRIASTNGALHARRAYKTQNDCTAEKPGWKDVLDLVLSSPEDFDPGTDQDWLERDPVENVGEIAPDQAGDDPYVSGFIAFHGYRDKSAPIRDADQFLYELTKAQWRSIVNTPEKTVNTQKHAFAETEHRYIWESATNEFHSERAFETVNSMVRFFKDAKPAPSVDYRRRQPLLVTVWEPVPQYGAEDELTGYDFPFRVCNTSSQDVIVDFEHRIFSIRQNCMNELGLQMMPEEIIGYPNHCLDGPTCSSGPLASDCYPCAGSCSPLDPFWVDDKLVPAGGCVRHKFTRNLTSFLSGQAFPVLLRHEVVAWTDDPRPEAPPGHSTTRQCPPVTGCFSDVNSSDELYDPDEAGSCGTPDIPVCSIQGRASKKHWLKGQFQFRFDPSELELATPYFF